MYREFCTRLILSALFLLTAACGNGGSINFDPGYIARTSKTPGFTLVQGGRALAVESGKTVATGVHAKLELNSTKGTTLTSGSYTAKIKYTTRNR